MRRDPFLAVLFAALAASLTAQERGKNQVAVFGRIHSVVQEGVPAAEVWVSGEDGKQLGKTVADGDGIFQLRRLPPGALRLHARAAGKVEGSIALSSAGQHRAATLVLEDGDPLRGTVTRRDGTPVAGAVVLVHAAQTLAAPLDWRVEVVADEKGVFSLPQAPLRDLVVRAWAPGFKLTDVFVRRQEKGEVKVALDGPAEPRRVRVNGMVAGQRVSVFCKTGRPGAYPYLPAVLREATVQADGTAQLWPLPIDHEVAVGAPGFRCFPVFIPCKHDVGRDLEFALTPLPPDVVAPSTRIAGQLVDELGRPLKGVAVLARVEGHGPEPAETDAEGGFVLDVAVRSKVLFQLGLAPGPWCLGDSRAALEPDGVTWLSIAADPGAKVKLHATRTGTIRGAPNSPAGVPIAAAQVVVERLDEKGKPLDRAMRLVSATDASGRIDIPGLPAGKYAVTVRDGAGVEGTASVDVPAGGEATIEALTFAPVGEVIGVVRGGDGRPVGGVQLALNQAQPIGGGRGRLPARFRAGLGGQPVLTDRDGRFRVSGLVPAEWMLSEVGSPAAAPGVVPAMVTFTVDAGQKVTVDLDVGK